jgi:ParB family chromosome partitioning protein
MPAETIQQIALEDLRPSKFNPRKYFDVDALEELAETIKARGIDSPLIVRTTNHGPGEYEIVAGERRFQAAKIAKVKAVPCIVREYSDAEAREVQIIENLQREGLSPLEEAAGYQDFLKAANTASPDRTPQENAQKVTVEDLAKKIGKAKRTVYARLELLKLSAPVQKALTAGKIEAGHAQELVSLTPERQKEMLAVLANPYNGRLSVSELRDEITQRYKPKPKADPKVVALQKKRAAEDKKWHERQALESKRNEAERKFIHAAGERGVALLWEKLKNANPTDAMRFADWIVADTAAGMDGTAAALQVAKGKPLPDSWVKFSPKEFAEHNRAGRLALLVLATAIDELDYGGPRSKEIFAWARIDRKKLLADVKREAAAKWLAAKKAVHKLHPVNLRRAGKVPTSAKPKAKGKKAAKAKK